MLFGAFSSHSGGAETSLVSAAVPACNMLSALLRRRQQTPAQATAATALASDMGDIVARRNRVLTGGLRRERWRGAGRSIVWQSGN